MTQSSSLLRSILPSLTKSVTKRYTERRILKTSPQNLLSVISDVDSYSSFLPLCTSSQIIRRSPCGTMYDATLTVGLPPLFTEHYVSRVTVDDVNMTVEARSIKSSSFDSLKSRWKLRESGDEGSNNNNNHCDVEFEVEMSVSDPIIKEVIDGVLEKVAGQQVEAFQRRCEELEGGKRR